MPAGPTPLRFGSDSAGRHTNRSSRTGTVWVALSICARLRNAATFTCSRAAAVQPGAQSGRADLALSAQPLARQLGVSQLGGYYGCQREGLEPVCQQPWPGPLASAQSPGLPLRPLCRDACYRTVVCDRKYTQVPKFPEIRISGPDTRQAAYLGDFVSDSRCSRPRSRAISSIESPRTSMLPNWVSSASDHSLSGPCQDNRMAAGKVR